MRRSKLDTSHIKEKVVKELATGKSQGAIAVEVGLNQSQVSRWSSKDEIRELIENEKAKLVEVVSDAVENVKGLVRGMKDIPKSNIKERELSYKASKDVLKSVGLLPTPINSQTLINIQGNEPILTPNIAKYLDLMTRHLTDDPDEMCT
jgi:predicted transcriptional regulator